MILCEFLPARKDRSWQLARQMGVTHAVVKCAPELTGRPPPWDRDALASIVDGFAADGITVIGLEGDPFDMSRIKLGLPGRDEDLALYTRMLANMAELGVNLLCYNFMAGTGWFRSGSAPGRGGAVCTRFRAADAPAATPLGKIPADRVWDNYVHFLNAVNPEALRLGVRMALHPDDPPLPSLSGIGRIFGSVEAFDRAHALAPNRANAVTFCQANVKLMGANPAEAAAHFGDRIAFIHVRDVTGTASDFTELFHDEMEVDQAALFRLYARIVPNAPVRCDHVPTMAGEGDEPGFVPGYAMLGRLFAVGYFKGLLDAQDIPYR